MAGCREGGLGGRVWGAGKQGNKETGKQGLGNQEIRKQGDRETGEGGMDQVIRD